MADVKIDDDNNSGHLIIDVDVEAPRVESDDDQTLHGIVGEVETTICAGALNTSGAGSVTTTGDGVVSATGAWAITTAGAGAITTAGAGSISANTAGAGSVTVSGGTGAGGVNTSGAGSVSTYTGMSAAKDNNAEEDCTKKLPWTVGVLGGLAQAAAAAAVLFKSPGGVGALGSEIAYRVGIASVFVAGLAEIVAAFWVSSDTQKRGATGKKILCVSVFTLLLGFALVGVAIVPKK
jgi:hypothetical protein